MRKYSSDCLGYGSLRGSGKGVDVRIDTFFYFLV